MPSSPHSEPHKTFRAMLIERRRRAGMTQADLAEKLGKPQNFVSRYERGERRLDVVELIAVADALGFDAAKLVRDLAKRMDC